MTYCGLTFYILYLLLQYLLLRSIIGFKNVLAKLMPYLFN